VVLTMWRTWFRAVDPPRRGYGPPLPYATSALWPWLVMIALVVQSLTESRILIEGGWLLLVLLAAKSRFDFQLPWHDDEPRREPWRRVPIPRETSGPKAAPASVSVATTAAIATTRAAQTSGDSSS